MTQRYLELICIEIDSHLWKYDTFLIIGDCNSEDTKEVIESFYHIQDLKNLSNKPTF